MSVSTPAIRLLHPEPLVLLGNIFNWNTNIESEIELRGNFVLRRFALHFADCAIQHLGVEFKTYGFDVSALLAAEQISGSAQFQVERGNLESGAKVGRILSTPPTCASQAE